MQESKAGTLWLVRRYVRSHIQLVPNILVLFGDNFSRTGLGGQAKECRGEPNCMGIPTKWRPLRIESAYFRDSDLLTVEPYITSIFTLAINQLRARKDVAYPSEGVGTGLAELSARAPSIAALINTQEGLLMHQAPYVVTVNNLRQAADQN